MIPSLTRPEARHHRLLPLLGACLTIGIGFAYPMSFHRLPELVVPGVVLGCLLAVVSFFRIEIGVAVALVLVLLNRAMIGDPAWLPGLAWVLVLGFLCVLRRLLKMDGPPLGAGTGPRRAKPSALPLALAAYAAVMVGGVVIAPDLQAVLPLLRCTVTGLVLFAVIVVSARTRSQMRWILGGLAVAGALPCVLVFFLPNLLGSEAKGYGRLTGGVDYSRLVAGYSHPNGFAGLLLLILPVLLAAAIMIKRARLLFLAVSVLVTIAVLGTLSRSALLALPLVALFFLVLRRPALTGPLAIGVSVLTAVLIVGGTSLPGGIGVSDDTNAGMLAGRLDFWEVAGDIWAANPVFGAGPGSFPSAYASASHVGKTFLPDTVEVAPPHAHNLFLNQLAEFGVVGLVALLAVLATATTLAIRLARRRGHWTRPLGAAGLGLLAAFVVQNQLDVTLVEVNTVMFFTLLGLLRAAAHLPEIDHASLG